MSQPNPKLRLGVSPEENFEPVIQNTPPLPAIDWSQVGQAAPNLLNTPSGNLPKADAVVITWGVMEWAAMEHVFCASASSMSYGERLKGSWSGWEKYDRNMPPGGPSGWTYWGYYRLVQIAGHTVLLFKSNTHLEWPGASYLLALIKMILAQVQPSLVLSTGTAGGAKTQDHVGTVRAVSAGTLYKDGAPPNSWPVYSNPWTAVWTVLNKPGFRKLLLAIPTTASDLAAVCSQFNQYYGTSYSLSQLDPSGLNMGDPSPQIDNQTGGAASLLTTASFVVGNTAGNYQSYACIEMDDAIVAQVCEASRGTAFGFVRNISDPVQNAILPSKAQGDWGGAIYDAYGFYTSYNGALAAWAILAGQ